MRDTPEGNVMLAQVALKTYPVRFDLTFFFPLIVDLKTQSTATLLLKPAHFSRGLQVPRMTISLPRTCSAAHEILYTRPPTKTGSGDCRSAYFMYLFLHGYLNRTTIENGRGVSVQTPGDGPRFRFLLSSLRVSIGEGLLGL